MDESILSQPSRGLAIRSCDAPDDEVSVAVEPGRGPTP